MQRVEADEAAALKAEIADLRKELAETNRREREALARAEEAEAKTEALGTLLPHTAADSSQWSAERDKILTASSFGRVATRRGGNATMTSAGLRSRVQVELRKMSERGYAAEGSMVKTLRAFEANLDDYPEDQLDVVSFCDALLETPALSPPPPLPP